MILQTNDAGVVLSPSLGNIHVYYYTIQRSLSLKPYGHSNVYLYKWGTNEFINNSGHMTKMATMPMYGTKLLFSGTDEHISRKLGL